MAMRHCDKCLENNWKFEVVEEIVRATCVLCGNEVEFATRERDDVWKTGKCRKCKTTLQFKAVKKPKTFKNYLYCPKCKAMYMGDKV